MINLKMIDARWRMLCGNGHELASKDDDGHRVFEMKHITHPKLKNAKEGDMLEECPECGSKKTKLTFEKVK